jgi:hypothetical protein
MSMTADTRYDAILVGGPRDGALLHTADNAVVEIEIEGLMHRYVVTTQERESDGRSYTVYNYDGEIDPTGAQPGAETPDGGHHTPIAEDHPGD